MTDLINRVALTLLTQHEWADVSREGARVLTRDNLLLVLLRGDGLTADEIAANTAAWTKIRDRTVALLYVFENGAPGELRELIQRSRQERFWGGGLVSGWYDVPEHLSRLVFQRGRDEITPVVRSVLQAGAAPLPDADYAEAAAHETAKTHTYLARLNAVRPWGTWLIASACIAMFIWATAAGGTTNNMVLLRFGAIYPPFILENGEWWRLFGATFLHIGLVHILVNMFSLLAVAPMLERIMGTPAFLALYTVAGLSGSLVTTYWHRDQPMLGAGASGALFGVFGAVVYVGWRYRADIPPRVRRQLSSGMIPCILYNLVISAQAGFDNAAHLGGLIGGVLAAALLTKAAVVPLWQKRWAAAVLLAIGLAPFAIEGYVAYRAAAYVGLAQSPQVAYLDPQNRFTFNYSSLLRPQMDEGLLVLVGFAAEYTVLFETGPTAGDAASEADAVVGELEKNKFKIAKRELRTIDSRKWLLLWGTSPEGTPIRFAITSDTGTLVRFRMMALDDAADDASRALDEMLQTFRLL